ncbi:MULTISPECIES: hypothetical protein [Halomonas]|uniref:hypothetical protein n=1 Tax=Halomonas TaxID=2745 RepID=UPI002897CD33|nr:MULTISPECIES: hypothetical protein [Halomonas]
MPISIEDALSSWLINDYGKGAISRKRLHEEIFMLYKKREYKGERITKIQIKTPRTEQFHRYTERLEIAGVIEADDKKSFFHKESKFYRVLSNKKSPTASLLCAVYPYAYISDLSAMQWYGITNRIPKVIYLTACNKKEWRNLGRAEVIERTGHPGAAEDFIPTYPVSGRHFGKSVYVSVKSNPKDPREGDEGVRVQDIGELFIDMLRNPEKCGGEQHVIDVYLEYAPSFKRRIIKYVNDYGRAIDKARVGFILGTVLGVESSDIDRWKSEKSNQRGGSRVLFPKSEYEEIYSPEWNISINYSELQKYGTMDC